MYIHFKKKNKLSLSEKMETKKLPNVGYKIRCIAQRKLKKSFLLLVVSI